MQITGILRQKVEIETNPKELVKALFLHYFQTDKYNIIVEKVCSVHAEDALQCADAVRGGGFL